MKLKYYMCGLGSGIILAVLVLMIANKIIHPGNQLFSPSGAGDTDIDR